MKTPKQKKLQNSVTTISPGEKVQEPWLPPEEYDIQHDHIHTRSEDPVGEIERQLAQDKRLGRL